MKRFLTGTMLVAFGLLIGLAIAEIAVRILAPFSRDHVVPPGMFAIDTALGWKLAPGYRGRHRTQYFDVEYSINSLGFRDSERSHALPDSTRRLLLFGDSQIFGWGVPLGQRLSDVAQAASGGLEIWDMAVPGYGFDQEVIAYAKRSEELPSSGAVFFASKATLSRMRRGILYRKPKPRFAVDSVGRVTLIAPQGGSTILADQLYRVLSPFYLPYFVETQWNRITRAKLKEDSEVRSTTPVNRETMNLAKAALVYAQEKAQARGHEIIVVMSLPEESTRELTAFLEANGMTAVSTGWAIPPENLIFGERDHHWKPELHTQLGRMFAPILARQPVSTM